MNFSKKCFHTFYIKRLKYLERTVKSQIIRTIILGPFKKNRLNIMEHFEYSDFIDCKPSRERSILVKFHDMFKIDFTRFFYVSPVYTHFFIWARTLFEKATLRTEMFLTLLINKAFLVLKFNFLFPQSLDIFKE